MCVCVCVCVIKISNLIKKYFNRFYSFFINNKNKKLYETIKLLNPYQSYI